MTAAIKFQRYFIIILQYLPLGLGLRYVIGSNYMTEPMEAGATLGRAPVGLSTAQDCHLLPPAEQLYANERLG